MSEKSPGLLARLFRRSPKARGGFIGELYARAIGRPLLVDAGRGAALLRGWLEMDGDYDGEPIDRQPIAYNGIAVIDVSGALVGREMYVPCSVPPRSYESIWADVSAALDDSNVRAIVLRMDSPGGEASGCFDLADRIHSARGSKPIVALVDDMACSAAYAIASACDSVWLSRTGAVGSVGVVAYHVDQSGYDRNLGVAVEYVYAGARKIDGNQHEPLSDSARAAWQSELDRLYGIFTATVARNRGLSEEAVRATEAALYFGGGAVDAGLADRVGTLHDLLVTLMADGAENPVPALGAEADDGDTTAPDQNAGASIMAAEHEVTVKIDAAAAQAVVDEAAAQMSARMEDMAAIVEACAAAGIPEKAAEHIRAGRSLDDVRATLAEAPEIRTACAAAGVPDLATDYIRSGASLVAVRAQLLDLRATEGPTAIRSHVLPGSSAAAQTAAKLNPEGIYARRRSGNSPR